MANRKKKPTRRPPTRHDRESADPPPFNNPFAGTLRDLRRKLRERAVLPPASRPKNLRDEAVAKATQPAPAPTDDEVFRDATAGAVPIEATARVRKRALASVERAAVIREADTPTDFTADEHFDVRFSDRYIRASADGVSHETLTKLERGEFAVRSHVDLHGMALEDAKRVVDDFLSDRQRNGDRCVLVITGKGRNSRHQVGVLREKIPAWLARGPSARRVLAFVTARPCDGGEGALYVLLRKRAARKARIDVVAGGGK